ncbi:MAG: phosphatidylserine decarboxylase, partial [Candidatus Babeliales bacterium]
IAFNAGVQSLTENERQLVLIKTKDYGTIAFVSVGALCVGRITHTYKPGQYYAKGEEAGYFSFGGSTLVLLFEKGKIKLTKKSMSKENSIPIKMGQQIAIKK